MFFWCFYNYFKFEVYCFCFLLHLTELSVKWYNINRNFYFRKFKIIVYVFGRRSVVLLFKFTDHDYDWNILNILIIVITNHYIPLYMLYEFVRNIESYWVVLRSVKVCKVKGEKEVFLFCYFCNFAIIFDSWEKFFAWKSALYEQIGNHNFMAVWIL